MVIDPNELFPEKVPLPDVEKSKTDSDIVMSPVGINENETVGVDSWSWRSMLNSKSTDPPSFIVPDNLGSQFPNRTVAGFSAAV
jgi:hypothetical protein